MPQGQTPLVLRDSLFSLPYFIQFVKNFFQSFFKIFEPLPDFSELFRYPPPPKQLTQYTKLLFVCQELFSLFFKLLRSAYRSAPDSLFSIPPPPPFVKPFFCFFSLFFAAAVCCTANCFYAILACLFHTYTLHV